MKAHNVTQGGKSRLAKAVPYVLHRLADPLARKQIRQRPRQAVGQLRM